MKISWQIKFAMLLALAALAGGPVAAQSLPPEATVETGHQTASSPVATSTDDPMVRYHVVVNGSDPDFASLGATVESAWKDRRVVTLPAAAVDGLAANAAVAYMRLVAQPQDGASFEGPSPFIDEQMKAVVAAPEGTGQWTTGSYAYDGAGNVKGIGPDSYGRTQSYTYDGVSRITYGTAHTKAGLLTEQYQYDAYGNMTWKSTGPSMATDPATNRLSGVTYDEAGHITQYGAANYKWDGGGMMTERSGSGPTTRFVYTPDDERIGTLHSAGYWSWTIRDFGGKVVREYESPSSGGSWLWVEDYAHGAGRLLASEREPSEGGRRHYHLDHLGTTRMVTSGETVTLGNRLSEHVYYPFGTESTLLVQEPNGRQTRLKYTGHERDYVGGETGENTNVLDYMHARYYNPNFGRFLSVDPSWKSVDSQNPQTWNRYSYVLNKPLNLTDPDGRNWVVKIVKITAKKIVTVVKNVDTDDGVRALKEGEDLLVRNRKIMNEVGRKASPDGSPPVIDMPHGPASKGYRTHGHVVDAQGNRVEGMGHIFMSGLVGVITGLVPGLDAEAANEMDEKSMIEARLDQQAGELFDGKTWNELNEEERKTVFDNLVDSGQGR